MSIKELIKGTIDKIVLKLLDWSAGYIINYFDLDNDGSVTKAEIKSKLGPNAKLAVKLLSKKL